MTQTPVPVEMTIMELPVLESLAWHGTESVEWAWHLEQDLGVCTSRNTLYSCQEETSIFLSSKAKASYSRNTPILYYRT